MVIAKHILNKYSVEPPQVVNFIDEDINKEKASAIQITGKIRSNKQKMGLHF